MLLSFTFRVSLGHRRVPPLATHRMIPGVVASPGNLLEILRPYLWHTEPSWEVFHKFCK